MSDPRQSAQVQEDLAAADAQVRPTVARSHAGLPTPVIMAGFGVLGIGVFLWMSAHRADAQPRRQASATGEVAAPPASPAAPEAPMAIIPGPQFTEDNSLRQTPAPALNVYAPPSDADLAQRRRAPTLVVDFDAAPQVIKASPPPAATIAAGAAKAEPGLSPDEKFADRLSGDDAGPAKASAMRDLDAIVPQGAVIPAVMETAINSDLPGLARAMVTRDIRSFDASTILIPRGSRVIGQYRSGAAQGASRVFVIWTRVIRPDGVSIQIASPAADPLGRGGLEGQVDRHFFSRFGGSILMSVLNAGVAAVGNARSTSQIYIGSAVDAANLAGAVTKTDGKIAPTIQTAQGAPVTIFVARDLDFSGVRR